MLREAVLAVGLIAILAFSAQALAAPVPGWTATLAQGSVVQGAQMLIEVTGPPNGTFAAIVNVQPFNSTAPAEALSQRLPAYAELANGSAVGEVALNTTSLGDEMVQVTLSTLTTGTFAEYWVQIGPGGPAIAAIDQQLQQLGLDLAENASRVYSLLSLRQDVMNWAEFTVAAAGALFAIETLLVASTWDTRPSAWLRRRGRGFLRGERGASHTGPWTITEKAEPPDPMAVFVAPSMGCDICDTPQRYNRVARHLVELHGLSVDEAEPRIRPDPKAEERAAAALRPQHERTGRPITSVSDRIDVGDVL